MYFFKHIFAVLIIIHVSEAQQGIYSPEGVDMSWTNNVTEEYIKHRYVESPIFDTFVGKNNHSMALLMCEHVTESYPKRCDLIIRTHSFNDQVNTKICKIHPPSEDDDSYAVTPGVTFLRGDRVLVFWKEQHKSDALQDRMKSRVLFAESCKESDFIHVDGSFHDQILRFKNFFYIMFSSKTCSKSFYCTVTYNYVGEPLYDIPLLLPIQDNDSLSINSAYVMNYDNSNEGPVLIGFMRPFDSRTKGKEVYSPIMGWINADNLYYDYHVYSNSNGFASICWKPFNTDEQFHCKWLDESHENMTLELNFKDLMFSEMPQIYNTPNGNILLIAPGISDDFLDYIFVDEADIDGKCRRIGQIRVSEIIHIEGLQFSMPRDNRFCISYLTHTCNQKHCDKSEDETPLLFNYRFVTRCVKIDPVNQKYVECGHGYWL